MQGKFQPVRTAVSYTHLDVYKRQILGCTELSLIKRDYPIGSGYLDALEVLAMCSVIQCKKPLKPQYQNLLTAETAGRLQNFTSGAQAGR